MVHKYRAYIITGIILIVLGVAWALYYTFFVFHITSTTPDTGAVSRYAPVLRLNFNKDIQADSVKVTGDIVKSSEVKEKTILVYLTDINLDKNGEYSFVVDSVSSKSGDSITNKKITFHTKDIPFSELSEEDKKIVLDEQEANREELYSDPIFQYLPHSTLSYSIEAFKPVSDVPNVKVVITAELSAADVRIDRNGAIQRANSEAMAYLNSLKDIVIADYDVQYAVNEPSLH